MPLTLDEVKNLEANRSPYGCGADDCLSCYPIIYGCWACDNTFSEPIRNGECYNCPDCDYCEACGAL